MKQEPYRDENYVLRCQHNRKLHVACDLCQEELRREAEIAEGLKRLWTVVGILTVGTWAFIAYRYFFS